MSLTPLNGRIMAFALIAAALTLVGATPFRSPTKSHEVRMVGTPGPRFEPAEIHVDAGDTVVFVLVSGGPHNVAFDSTELAPAARQTLRRAMHDEMMPLAGPFLVKEGDRYAVSFARVPSGRYQFYCLPHMGQNMRGTVVVR
jgi:plastocyanin